MLQKLATISATVASTVAVPNSLGPAELLLHYGTKEQKNYYLPRLADGRRNPLLRADRPVRRLGCDLDSRLRHRLQGDMSTARKRTRHRSTFDKRYITLAPIATVIGLAFRMYDPDHLLGDKEDLGITLALLPRDTPGWRSAAAISR